MSAYPEYMQESLAQVAKKRNYNVALQPKRMAPDAKTILLEGFHPDYRKDQFTPLKVGANKGQKVNIELAETLQSHSRLNADQVDLKHPDYDTDILIIGGGGAGCAAAIEADKAGAKVIIATKLRLGDANTMMAEGGIQGATKPNDSPAQHYIDAYGGGHFAAKKELLYKLVTEGPEAIKWLNDLGVEFDKEDDGTMVTMHGGGTSRKRMHAAKDYTGAEIMRTLRAEVECRQIPIINYNAALELIQDENGACCGAVTINTNTKELKVIRAKTTIIATGGAGRLHYQGFPTSNHYGATADGLVLAYHCGAKLFAPDTLQYHPTGAAYPQQILGALVTEKVRGLGAKMVNVDGDVFVHPLETRDVAAASVIRECVSHEKGIRTPDGGQAVWLDTPMIEIIHGEGAILDRIPGMFKMFDKYGIDMRKEPILIYPTLHYQNGGIDIDANCEVVGIPNLYAAGEVVGGIHGRNRLMGNSLLDVIVFGRDCGIAAAERASKIDHFGTLNLDHIAKFEKELKEAGIETNEVTPLLFPNYRQRRNYLDNTPFAEASQVSIKATE